MLPVKETVRTVSMEGRTPHFCRRLSRVHQSSSIAERFPSQTVQASIGGWYISEGGKALQHIRIITDTCKTLKSWEHTSLIFIDLHWIQKQDEIRQSSRTIHCHTMPTTIHNVNITCDLSHGYCWAMAGFIAWGFVTAWQGRTAAQLKSHHLSATIRLSATVLAHLGSLLWSTRLVHPFAASQVNDIVGMGRDEWELTIF